MTLDRHDAVVLTLRGFAIYAWFKAFEFLSIGLLYLSTFTSFARSSGERPPGFNLWQMGSSPVLTCALYLAAGFFLFVRSRDLATRLLPEGSVAEPAESSLNPVHLAAVAFAVFGLATLLSALGTVVSVGLSIWFQSGPFQRASRWSIEMPNCIVAGLKVLVGLLFCFKARAVAGLWWKKQQPPPPVAALSAEPYTY